MTQHSLEGSGTDGAGCEEGCGGLLSQPADGHSQANGYGAHGGGRGKGWSSFVQSASRGQVHDMVCLGFGPAGLAIAVAIHDAVETGRIPKSRLPSVVFVEKQARFAWHAGMLLPGAKMQISFIKDLASLRDPRSRFTFLNFLHEAGRLVDFINLDTFLPARAEFEEYLRWCADHFGHVVRYGQEALSVTPVPPSSTDGDGDGDGGGRVVSQFDVIAREVCTGKISTYRAKNVLVAVGGQPSMPPYFPSKHPRIIHSSQYAQVVPSLLKDRDKSYRVAVIGAGQSAAEIFDNVQTLYPNSRTTLIMRSEFLKPSDDSPFVNSVFNPEYTDIIYSRPRAGRQALLRDARSTNYAVVRLPLLEKIYEGMYHQKRVLGPDPTKWPHRIFKLSRVVGLDSGPLTDGTVGLRIRPVDGVSVPGNESEDDYSSQSDAGREPGEEVLHVDLVVCATGYQRESHLQILDGVRRLLPEVDTPASGITSKLNGVREGLSNGSPSLSHHHVRIGRDYSLQFAQGKVAPGSGIYLQGCNEQTHGLSDTLLSVLAVRSGEIVSTIFGGDA